MSRRRQARLRSGAALLGAFASTIRLLRWLLVVLVGIYLCSGITRVGPNEDALIYRLGRLQRDVHPPGLLLALPPPIDRVVRVPTRTQHEVFALAWTGDEEEMARALSVVQQPGGQPAPLAGAPPAGVGAGVIATAMPPEMQARLAAGTAANPGGGPPPDKGIHPWTNGYSLTGDANIVQARFTLRYRIVDPFAYLGALQESAVGPLLEHNTLAAATREMAGLKIDEALGPGLESFRARVVAATQQRLDALQLGLQLIAFEVNAITPPVAAAAAFADVTSAQVQARTTLEKARTYRAQALPAAQSEAFRLRAQAESSAQQLVSRATAEAGSFRALSAEHRLNPALLENRLRAESLESVLPQFKATHVLPDGGKVEIFLPAP